MNKASPFQSAWKWSKTSVWAFPSYLFIILIILTIFKVSGSSVGVYHKLLYSESGKSNDLYSLLFNGESKDGDLLLNRPQAIRSDEWLVNTQLTIAQKNNNFERINENIGQGEDVSLSNEPYKEWTALFKPHNLPFFVLPFDHAFAMRWWLLAYLLVISCYFFILTVLPNKRFLAILLGLSVLFTPFIQWWYLYGTLGTIFYSLFGLTIFIRLLREKRRLQKIFYTASLAYILTCFAFILYPPFQIPVALAASVFALGYGVEKLRKLQLRELFKKIAPLIVAVAIASTLVFIFVATRSDVIESVQNSLYPGDRIARSGGWLTQHVVHVFSGNLGAQLQYPEAQNYRLFDSTNVSEASNFLIILPYLLFPSLLITLRYRSRYKQIDWSIIAVFSFFIILLARATIPIPKLDFLGKLVFLDHVGHSRLLIGFGLLNFFALVLFIRRYSKLKNFVFSRRFVLIYALVVFLTQLFLGVYVKNRSPGFIETYKVLLLSVPVPLFIYLVMRKKFEWAVLTLLILGLYMTHQIHPFYKGISILTKTPISQAIREISSTDKSRWAVDEHLGLFENFAYMNGAKSLTGVYLHPQMEWWPDSTLTTSEDSYNRYAHTTVGIDKDPDYKIPTTIRLNSPDSFTILTEPCGEYLRNKGVRYLIMGSELSQNDKCAALIKKVEYPTINFYIYKINFTESSNI